MQRLKISLISFALSITLHCTAQIIDVRKTTESVITNRTNQAINDGINRGVNAVFNAPWKIHQKIKENRQQENQRQQNGQQSINTTIPSANQSVSNNNVQTASTNSGVVASVADMEEKTSSATEFIPGNTIFWSDDFATNATGKFPDQWRTNSAGEVREVEGSKWLQLSSDGLFAPKYLKDLPENFSFEFDAIFNKNATKEAHYILYLYATKDMTADFKETSYPGNGGIYFALNSYAGEVDTESFENGKVSNVDFHLVTNDLKATLSNKTHVAINKAGTKVSLFLNGNEVFSSANALSSNYTFDAFKFGSFYMKSEDFMLISNLKVTTK